MTKIFRYPWLVPGMSLLLLMAALTTIEVSGPLVLVSGSMGAWASITVAISVQALPFLVLGTIVSGLISAFVPPTALARVTPRNPFVAVPTAGVAGMVLPGCECASVPVAQSLMRRGLPPAAALAFLLAAPAVNPVVLVSTAVAFQGNRLMVWARLVASLVTVILVGWIWVTFAKDEWMKPQGSHCDIGTSRAETFRATAIHDLLNAGGYLVVGAMAAALMKTFVPQDWVLKLAENPLLSVVVMAGLAVLLSLCSEADAFVAASLTTISPTAQLAFLVVGPMVDVKLFAMQVGAFGSKFATRFMSLTLVAGIFVSLFLGRAFFGA